MHNCVCLLGNRKQHTYIRGRVSKWETNRSKTAVMGVIGFLCISLGSSTVQFHNCLCNRRACAVQKLVLVAKMAAVLEECTNEEQSSVVRFFGQKDSMRKMFINKCVLFTMWNVCRVKRFRLGGKCLTDEEVEMEVGKWLRQESEDFYAVGFGAQVKWWDTCIDVGGEYIEK
jgi:hypothetical protein